MKIKNVILITIIGLIMNNTFASPLYYQAESVDKTVLQMVERWHAQSKSVTFWDGVKDEKLIDVEDFNKMNSLKNSTDISYSLKQVVNYYNRKNNNKYQICWYNTKEVLAVIRPRENKCEY